MGNVVVFAPSPVLSVTVEDQDGTDAVHVHAAGQGVWQTRMLRALGAEVTMCSVLAGETGGLLKYLLEDEGIRILTVDGSARSGAYIHDRRGGERVAIAESGGEPLARHDLDRLYGITLKAGMEAGTVILSGAASEHVVTADVYRRLASDLNTVGCRVIADLSGDRLSAALAGGLTVVKVADDELESDGRVKSTDTDELISAMHQLASEGADNVVVTRAEEPSLLLADGKVSEIHMPSLEVVDHHGAGDSLTAGVAATLADGGSITDAVTLGAAAGALNVTRHGLGSGDAEAVQKLRELVELKPVKSSGGAK